jgi:hypothetical protein
MVPLVIVESEVKGVDALFGQFKKHVDGIPSNLPAARTFVSFFLELSRTDALRAVAEARDDELLKASLAFQREVKP